ncbi:hypothetical protein GCM10027586_00740 [Kineococcus gypseus]|uniref:hypothetical protein n=1 Tax=Kineococcus gypseus TaxID=1637102 RepID=UPI003D7E195B
MPARLEDPVLGVLLLDAEHGFSAVTIDPGFPVVRVNAEDRPNANGQHDDTALFGARAVTVQALVMGTATTSRRELVERVRAYCHPARRPTLVWHEGDGVERRADLRGEGATAPLTGSLGRELTATWSCPSGVLYAAEESVVEVPAGGIPEPGIRLPVRFPVRFPRTTLAGTVAVANGDVYNTDADHVTQLWGPCTSPRLVNVTTGLEVCLPGLQLAAAQYVEVNTAAPSLLLNGRGEESVWGWQEPGVSELFQLAGGVNALRYAPAKWSGRARAVVTFRPATL